MSTQDSFPRVLIFGETFNNTTGGGITLNSLFEDWPIENVFVLTDRFSETSNTKFRYFYQLGDLEQRSLINKIGIKSGFTSQKLLFENSEPINEKSDIKAIPPLKKRIYFKAKNIFIKSLNLLGIYNSFFFLNTSKSLLNWILEIKPDLIYFQPNSILKIKLLLELHNQTKIPYMVHVMDNFFDTFNKSIICKKAENKEIIRTIQNLIDNSDACLAICNEMAKIYEQRYHKHFSSFQHSVNRKFWDLNYKVNENPEKFTILYAGRIGIGTQKSLFLLSDAVAKCNQKYNINIELKIQTTSHVQKTLSRLSKYRYNKVLDPITYIELPKRYSESDLLVLPMDFYKKSFQYIKFSMPTKVPEYLSTGVPILVFAPSQTALYKYAEEAKWAFLHSDPNVDSLTTQLYEIYTNYLKRNEISLIARKVANENHNRTKVKLDFYKLIKCIVSQQSK